MDLNKKWSYIGAFLTPESKEKMLEMFKNNIPADWKPYCHHMTLAFNNHTEDVMQMYDYYESRFGETVELTITHFGSSDRAMAAKVMYSDKLINKLPHVTIAVAPEAKPVESNYITEWTELPFPVKIKAIIGKFPN